MVGAIRNIEKAIAGNGIKLPSKSEEKNISTVRKSLFTRKGLNQGDIIASENLVAMRPGDGISPMLIDLVVGKQLSRAVKAFQKLSFQDFL